MSDNLMLLAAGPEIRIPRLPAVSCILPTGYGDQYVGMAIQCFLDQNYQGPLELVIVDNNLQPVEFGCEMPVGPASERFTVKYIHCDKMTVGAYRNLGTEQASGEICISWDEDDWSSKDRVATQVARLQESGKAVTGFHNILFWNEADQKTYKYFYESDRGRKHAPYACGTSQCYLKSWWMTHKFPEINLAEDWEFTKMAREVQQLDSIDGGHLCVARAHMNSQSPPLFGHVQFPLVERSTFPEEFFEAIGK